MNSDDPVGTSDVADTIMSTLKSASPFEVPPPAAQTAHKLPSADKSPPFVDDPDWLIWADAILEEAKGSVSEITGRRWLVIHPDDALVLSLAERADAGAFPEGEVETPRVVRWRSAMDNREYALIEFLSLARQPAGG